ncbi:MAG TPA: glycosyltransferase family 4 protein [Thermoanaerobaculia bacterium]
MKIGFFGNTNNYPFMLARALRKLGHEVLFIIESDERLNRPEFRYDDIATPYPAWILDLAPFRFSTYLRPGGRRAAAIDALRGCDAVIVNGLGPSLLRFVRRPSIAILTGSDLNYFADFASLDQPVFTPVRRPRWLWKSVAPHVMRAAIRRLIGAQRDGIRRANAFYSFPPGTLPHGDRVLREIGVDDVRRFFFLMGDLDQIAYEPPPQNERLRVVSSARLNWKRPLRPEATELDLKGTDVIIRGLALFGERVGVPMEIRLVRKGLDVLETERLVEQCGLSKDVVWLDEMSQKDLREEFRRADLVIDQLGLSLVGMAGLDAMAMGKPLVANGRPEIMASVVPEASPICQASTPEEVAQQLERLIDPAERERVGRASRDHVLRYFTPEHAARICLERLERAILKRGNSLPPSPPHFSALD